MTSHGKTRPDLGKTAFRPAQRRVFRRLCQTGICRARTGDALGGDRRAGNRQAFGTPKNPVAAPGGGPATGTGNAGAAGGGPGGPGNPALVRRPAAAGQSLLRLERGGKTGAAAGAAVAPRTAQGAARARRKSGGRGG